MNVFHDTLHPLTGTVTSNAVNGVKIGGGTIGSSWAISQNTNYGLSFISIGSTGTYSHALTFETNGNITLPRTNQNITFTGSTPSIVGTGVSGPLNIDPNFSSTNYIRVYDQLTVEGSFSVTGTKSFSIPHPNKTKRDDGYYLYHSCVESPNTGDTIQYSDMKLV